MTGFFEQAGPRWYTIPAHRPFVQDLARGLHEALSPLGPEALSQAIVLTPTRRGARALADAFVAAAGGRAVLPPQIRPMGDLDDGEPPFEPGDLALDLPAAIDPLRRRFELTKLVSEHAHLLAADLMTASACLELAEALGGFFDSLQIEEIEVEDRLASLVDTELAEHWQVSRNFLEAALVAWPRRLKALGVADLSERRVRMLRRLAEQWTRNPPEGVLVAAGSTGTAPATRDLLIAVANAPRGSVVLPGLDQDLADKAWAKVDVQHPQGALKRLLDRAEVAKHEVNLWPASVNANAAGRWRRRIVNEALRPAEETADWLRVITDLRTEGAKEHLDPIIEGLKGLSFISARTEEEAATVAALLLREVLETPDQTAALVTPDQVLARRVTAKLARWGVIPDSSVGESLSAGGCGTLAELVARAAADPVDPVTLLGLLKHPLVQLGDSQALEKAALRGSRPRDWTELTRRLAQTPEILPLAKHLEAILNDLAWMDEVKPAPEAARRVATAMEALSASDAGPSQALWAGHGGEAMSRLLGALINDGEGLPNVTARGFADLLSRLMAGETLRNGGATHPRLRILGAIEARLVQADRLVLAGLEEGVWPRGAGLDPFLSRPMRETLGLPSPERRIGLAAHDFAQAACAPEVVLLHTERRDGAPSVRSRWLWRLETVARGAGSKIPERPQFLDWARRLDAPDTYEPFKRPAPKPPLADRPREMAVTRIETLTRDPYAVWARDILRLYPLDRPDVATDARARGTAIHAAFERFAKAYPADLPHDVAGVFANLYVEELEKAGIQHEAMARERALAVEAADWVAALEHERRDGRSIHVELKGGRTIQGPAGPFRITARADRIEVTADGFGHILDYKTGKAPSSREVATGFSPQLTLTAAILAAGGFPELGALRPGDLTYLEISGRKPAGRVETRAAAGDESAKAAASALDGLGRLVADFDDPAHPYLSRIAPQFVKARVSDYDHLARVFEWSTSGEEGEE